MSKRLSVAAFLAEVRAEAGITQSALALKLNRPQSFVAKIETANRDVSLLDFLEIAPALDIEPAKLVNRLCAHLEKRPARLLRAARFGGEKAG